MEAGLKLYEKTTYYLYCFSDNIFKWMLLVLFTRFQQYVNKASKIPFNPLNISNIVMGKRYLYSN